MGPRIAYRGVEELGWRERRAIRPGARFWAKISPSLLFGVITRLPMEFQFGQLGRFSTMAGGVIGQTLAMEGCSPSSSNPRFSALPLRRKEAGASRSLLGGAHGLHRLVLSGFSYRTNA